MALIGRWWVGISPNNGGTGVDAMGKQLSDESGGFPYVRVDLPCSPTSSDVAAFKSRLIADTDGGASLVGNAMEVYSGPHLVGHPNSGTTIYHWFPRGKSGRPTSHARGWGRGRTSRRSP
ncbi:hypothetical protein ACFVUH_16305 [Kitasatospora sp. NPDC058032]|uniref:hypothetical protein n=1 Tax=Kitasatospora sp. NPDC058032 TaxID=3346307 RepID=UPI0036DEB1A9